MNCYFCNCYCSSAVMALDMGWIDRFFASERGIVVHRPVCALCKESFLSTTPNGYYSRPNQSKGKPPPMGTVV